MHQFSTSDTIIVLCTLIVFTTSSPHHLGASRRSKLEQIRVVVVVVVVVWIRARLFRWVELSAPQASSELWSQEKKMAMFHLP